MYIVFDSNIWYSELALNSNLGAAVRFFIRKNGAKVALPEVVRLETEHNLRSRLNKFIDNIRDDHRQLLTVFGKLKEVVLPETAAVEAKIAFIFNDLGVEIIEIPFSLESARSSFLKTISKQPPSHNTQQFKDGVLWADCVGLLELDEVILVSSDKAFYEGSNYAAGPAQNLKAETAGANHPLRLVASLGELLKEIKTEIEVEVDALEAEFRETFRQSIDGILERNSFGIEKRQAVRTTLYVTEQPSWLYIEFELEYVCVDLSNEGRADATLILRGDGKYDALTGSVGELRNHGESLSFRPIEGGDKVVKNQVIMVGSIVVGHREVTHSVKYKLD